MVNNYLSIKTKTKIELSETEGDKLMSSVVTRDNILKAYILSRFLVLSIIRLILICVLLFDYFKIVWSFIHLFDS